MDHLKKIEELIETINSDFRKKIFETEKEMTFNFNYLYELKHFLKLYTICLLEICHELHFIGLDFFPNALLKLFQSFKVQTAYFLKFHINFFQRSSYEQAPKNGYFFFFSYLYIKLIFFF